MLIWLPNPAHSPTVMKLDVEGHELDVLQGASNPLKASPPHTIVFEADANENCEVLDQRIKGGGLHGDGGQYMSA
jgi:hypothetical protein